MGTSANFAGIPISAGGIVVTGDASRSAPTTKTTIVPTSTNGCRIERLTFCALGTTTPTLLRLFRYTGSVYRLKYEIVVPAQTSTPGVSSVWQTTLESWSAPNNMPIILAPEDSLVATINDTQAGGGIAIDADVAAF